MKKLFLPLAATALMMLAAACNKEQIVDPPAEDDTTHVTPPAIEEPTYQEGIYEPLMKIASIEKDDGNTDTWNWTGDLLTSVSSTDGTSRQYTYDNRRLVSATGAAFGASGDVMFTYDGDQLARCMVSTNDSTLAMLTFNHADGRISGADVAVDARYISGMLDGLIPSMRKGRLFDPKQITLDENDNSIHVDFVWSGKDVARVVVTGDIPFELTKEMYEAMKPYLPVDSSQLALVDLYFMISNSLPMQILVNDTIDYTYDNKINPFYCYLGEINPTCFSLHNVLSASNQGRVAINVTLMSPMQVFEQPIEDYKVYTYDYNDRNYPVEVIGSENYTITYR